ncbi:hypothetical protein NEMBOFW57_000307 [Staphylotrichum longicolle]|uniref:Alternative sulfate transporter n=1 Tax=Staphylotrichum longicolle TaxID=669026 RepID=A0AAD4EZ25_9PEZI|nr:hypothetical protein NEMBOFW57_000307 [Staphylotrichum longicolle]
MADEKKQIATLAESQLSRSSDDEGQEVAPWTEAEEQALVRRVDFLVVPILTLGLFALQLDRGNIGNALTDFFLQDVGITQFQFNIGQQLLSAGIVLLEAFQKGLGAYLSTRLLLGLLESGFIPAALYTLTRWYKRGETTKRFAWYYLGNLIAGGCSGLAAYGILHMRGIGGLAGWQWMFLIEGAFTVLVGVVFISIFPRSPANPVSLLGYRYFTEREAQILHQRVILDDPTKVQPRPNLTNWRLLPHILMTILALTPAQTLGAYAPSLVVSFGFDRLKSNAMLSIGSWLSILTNIGYGWVADKLNRRGPVVLVGVTILWALIVIYSKDGNLRFGLLVTAVVFQVPWHGVNGAWMSLNARTAGERSVTMAIFVMSANLSGIIGSQLFQASDAPLYKKGWTIEVALVSTALLMCIIGNLQYWVLNRLQKREGEARYHY